MSLVTAAMAGSCQDGIGRAGKYTPHDGDEDDGDDDDGDDDDDDNGDCSNIFVPLTGSWFYFGESVDFLSKQCFELEVASNLRSGMKLCFQNSLFLIEGFGKHDSIHSNSFMTTKTPSSDMIVRTNMHTKMLLPGVTWYCKTPPTDRIVQGTPPHILNISHRRSLFPLVLLYTHS